MTDMESQQFKNAVASEAVFAVEHRTRVLAHVGPDAFTDQDFLEQEPNTWTHTTSREYTSPEVQVAKRCHGFHLELLKLDTTPVSTHYQLIHYDVPILDPETHQVKIKGLVQQEMSLNVKAVRERYPAETHSVLMACAGTGRGNQKLRLWAHVPWGPDSIGCSKWTGCSLADILKDAGPLDGATQVIFTGADKGVEGGKVQYFQRSLSLEDAMKGHCMICYEQNGQPLTPAHGAPLRLIVPGWYGMASVKWLTSIEIVQGGWWGHQMDAYSFKTVHDDPKAVPLKQLPVRALMVPPGCPEFVSRTRLVSPGMVRVEGKAWAGAVELDRVEFSSDNGTTWQACVLGEKNGSFGWASWHVDWQAEEGTTTVLCCRAFDKGGRNQDLPSDEMFNYGSFGSTQPQQVYTKVSSLIDEEGAEMDFTSEYKAARNDLRGESDMSQEHMEALYRAPGSQ